MKATITKHENLFFIDLTPETPEETLQVVQFGMNKTRKLDCVSVYVGDTIGNTGASLVIGAKKIETRTL